MPFGAAGDVDGSRILCRRAVERAQCWPSYRPVTALLSRGHPDCASRPRRLEAEGTGHWNQFRSRRGRSAGNSIEYRRQSMIPKVPRIWATRIAGRGRPTMIPDPTSLEPSPVTDIRRQRRSRGTRSRSLYGDAILCSSTLTVCLGRKSALWQSPSMYSTAMPLWLLMQPASSLCHLPI